MKISRSVRNLYEERAELAKKLEAKVKEIFEAKKRAQWFYNGRVKTLESFAQKLETGRVVSPEDMEDLFACTLVVENRGSIKEALKLISAEFQVLEKRPRSSSKTHKSPEAFPFDDLRLYVKLKENESLPSTPVQGIKFEVQVKTFLQHAWGIATHDLIYKGNAVDWAKARVAYQIKAMLEHAEISVEQVESLATSTGLAMTDHRTKEKQKLISWFGETWTEESLPKDLVRLSDTVLDLCEVAGLKSTDAIKAVAEETAAGRGAALVDLSPYSVILKSLLAKFHEPLVSYLSAPSEQKGKKIRVFGADDPELKTVFSSCHPDKYVYIDSTVERGP